MDDVATIALLRVKALAYRLTTREAMDGWMTIETSQTLTGGKLRPAFGSPGPARTRERGTEAGPQVAPQRRFPHPRACEESLALGLVRYFTPCRVRDDSTLSGVTWWFVELPATSQRAASMQSSNTLHRAVVDGL